MHWWPGIPWAVRGWVGVCAGAVGGAGWAGQEVTTVDSNCIPTYAFATERGRAHGGTPRTGSARALRPGIWRKGGGGRGGRLPEEKARTARGVSRHAARAFRHDGAKKNYLGSGVGGRGRGAGMCALVSQWSARGSRVTGPPTAVGRGDRQLASWRPRSSRCAPQSSLSRHAGPMGQFHAKHTILGTLLEAGPARPLATRS